MKTKILFCLVASAVPAWGQSSATLTYAQVAAAVEAANPELAAARARARAAGSRVSQAWTPESPVLEFEREGAATNRAPWDGPEKIWSVRQDLDLPTASYLKGKAAAAGAGAADAEAEKTRRRVLMAARKAFAVLRLVWVEKDLIAQNIDIVRRVARVAESKVSAGKAGQADALKAQVELSKLQGLLEFKAHEVQVAEAELSAMMGREPGPLPRPEEPSEPAVPAEAELQHHASSRNPMLRAAALEATRAEAEAALAKAELLPKVMLQYRRRRTPMSGATHDAVAGFTVPLWLWSPAARIRESSEARAAARADAEGARLGTMAGVRSTFGHWTAAVRLSEVYRTAVLPQAESALRTAEAAYQSDRGGFLDLLDAQRSLLELTLEHERLRAEAQMHRGELEDMVGQEL